MSDAEQFNSVIDAIQAIPNEALQTSRMPIKTYLQEAENLYRAGNEDFEQLATLGLNRSWVDSLPVRIGALRHAQSQWQTQYQMRKEGEAEWAELAPKAYAFRDHLERHFRYAFRHMPQALKQVRDIAEGSGQDDLVQDYSDLAALGKQYSEALQAINFDLAQLDQAAEQASNLGELLAKVNGDRLEGNTARVLRDQAYTYLKQAVDEVRDCGKLVFHNNSRAVAYRSKYFRNRGGESGNNAPGNNAPSNSPGE